MLSRDLKKEYELAAFKLAHPEVVIPGANSLLAMTSGNIIQVVQFKNKVMVAENEAGEITSITLTCDSVFKFDKVNKAVVKSEPMTWGYPIDNLFTDNIFEISAKYIRSLILESENTTDEVTRLAVIDRATEFARKTLLKSTVVANFLL